MFRLDINLNRSGKFSGSTPNPVSDLPTGSEVSANAAAPTSRFEAFLLQMTSEGESRVIDSQTYLNQPSAGATFLLLCLPDESKPSQCRVVYFVARVAGVSKEFKVGGSEDTVYTCVFEPLFRPGQVNYYYYCDTFPITSMNLKVLDPTVTGASFVFRPAYDRMFLDAESEDGFFTKWVCPATDSVVYCKLFNQPNDAKAAFTYALMSPGPGGSTLSVNGALTVLTGVPTVGPIVLQTTSPDFVYQNVFPIFSLAALTGLDAGVFYWYGLMKASDGLCVPCILLMGDPTNVSTAITTDIVSPECLANMWAPVPGDV